MSNKTGARPPSQKRAGQNQKQNQPQLKIAAGKTQPAATSDAKHEARMQRHAAARAASDRRRRAASMRRLGLLAVLFLVVAGGGLAFYLNEADKPGQSVAQQPSPHLQKVEDPHSYSTNPPTSGPHLADTAPWGVSATVITKELQVHNLEDGGVIINYRPDLDKATVDRLAELARSYDTAVLMSPYPDLSHPIVVTAWNRVDRLEALDEARIRRFVDEYRGKDRHRESGS